MADETLNEKLHAEAAIDPLRAAVNAVTEVRTTRRVKVPPLESLPMHILDSGPGGDPPYRAFVVVGVLDDAETFYVDELPEELARAVVEARRAWATRYRDRKVSPA